MYDPDRLENVVHLEVGQPSAAKAAAFEKRARTVNGVLKNPRPWVVQSGFGIEVQYLFTG